MQSGGIIASADDFLPIFIYVLSRAQLEHIHSTVEFINQYINAQDKQGEPYYYFIQMTSAVAYLENVTVEDVKEKMGEKRKKEEEAVEHERQRAAAEAAEHDRLEKEKEAERLQKERLTEIPKEVVVAIDTVVIGSSGKSDAFIEDIPPLAAPNSITPESYIKLLDSVKEVVPVCESKPSQTKSNQIKEHQILRCH